MNAKDFQFRRGGGQASGSASIPSAIASSRARASNRSWGAFISFSAQLHGDADQAEDSGQDSVQFWLYSL